jgi:hypothetical protein
MEDTVTSIYGSGGGNYLKADDLHGEDWELVISGWDKKEMDQTDFETGEKYKKWKVILSFVAEEKKLVCNKTNADAIKAAYGDHLSDWIGQNIILYEGKWQDKPCLRVRTPKAVKKVSAEGRPKHSTARDERNPPPPLDDEIPF